MPGKHVKSCGRKQKKKEKSYELNVYQKRCSQLSQDIYALPLHIKLIIFRMAILSHMDEWMSKHKEKMYHQFYDTRNWHKTFSCLDLIQAFGEQRPEPNFFEDQYTQRRRHHDELLNIPMKYRPLLCRRSRVLKDDGKGGKIFDRRKITIYNLSGQYIPYNIQYRIRPRRLSGKPHYYWVEKKCRCITCDLIRLQNKDWAYVTSDTREKEKQDIDRYNRIEYIGGGQWKTFTESEEKPLSTKQLKAMKKKEKLSKKI